MARALKKNQTKSKGFTLIELLVVIAIIGILSAVVLAALNTARAKGNDAAIKSNLDTVRTQSVIYFDKNTGFSDLGIAPNPTKSVNSGSNSDCYPTSGTVFNDPTVLAALQGADANVPAKKNIFCQYAAGKASAFVAGSASVPLTVWTVWAPTAVGLGLTPAQGWCIDNTGFSGVDTRPTNTLMQCP